jgi:aconitate hydratase
VYLTSGETAVASALKGELGDPRSLDIPYPRIEEPQRFIIDDTMIIAPDPKYAETAIVRGPNIGVPPENTPLNEDLQGEIAIKVEDKITTDHIMPAGDKLKYRSNIPKYAEFVFSPLDEGFSKRALANKEQGKANIIIAGLSYGQGSSREHAALCPMYLGVKAVVAKSFERIHIANLINAGIIPFTFHDEGDYDKIQLGDQVRLDSVRSKLQAGRSVKLKNLTRDEEYPLNYNLTEEDTAVILAGGKLNYLQA